MKKTVITLAAALTLGVSWAALAQEQDPILIIPDGKPGAGQQQGQSPDQQPQKKRKREAEPSAEQQFEQPQPEQKRRKKQAEQPDGSTRQPSGEQQFEQPRPEKKRKKQQVEQPVEQPTDLQAEQPRPEKKRKKQQAEQPDNSTQPPSGEQQFEQPEKKRKKQQVEQPAEQPTDQQAEQPQPEKKRKKQAEQPDGSQPPAPEQTTGQPKPRTPGAAGVPSEVTQYLSDTRPVSELTDAELAQRMRTGRSLSKMRGLPDDVRLELAGKARQARTEAIAREQGKATGKVGNQPVPGQQPGGEQPTTGETQVGGPGPDVLPGEPAVNPDKKDVQKLDGNKASPQAEAKARAYLDDGRSGDQLRDDELRSRVDGMRDLLGSNELSQIGRAHV